MSKDSASQQLAPFHKELLQLMLRQSESHIEDRGIDPTSEPIKDLFKKLSLKETLPLPDIIEKYQDLLHMGGGSIHTEKSLLEAFPAKDFMELGLSRYYPRVYRGLPRVYLRDHASQSHIKKNFTHLASVKKQALSKSLFSLYSSIPVSGKVTIFTWVMNDGMGDFVAATEVMRLIKSRLVDVDLQLVALVHEKMLHAMHFPQNTLVIPYRETYPQISQEMLKALKESDLIVQLPTYYPLTDELKNQLPSTRWEMVGEYGFIESSWFHPKSDNHCLGLHFLEKGILTRKSCEASWQNVQNEKLKKWRRPENRFYLAYLATPIGGAIYLHSLLKSLENDETNIDICVPDLGWFITFAEKQKKAGRSLLEWEMGIASIEIYFEDKFCSIDVAPKGKTVRLLCPGVISQSDFRALLALSEEWVAIRGDQSFSEAVSQGKAFFYDGREHARYFIKDFAAIAENRISSFPSTLECIRGMSQGFLYHVGLQEGDWVDETYFQDLEDWRAIALKIGLALQDPEALAGFKKFDRIIVDEFSANSFLTHLIQRGLFLHKHPYVAELENDHIEKFIKNEITFKELIRTQKTIIDSCQKNKHM